MIRVRHRHLPYHSARVDAEFNTNCMPMNYIVLGKRDLDACRIPFVQLQFGGSESYIDCQ